MRRMLEGGRIDRNAPLEFTFNGKAVVAYRGDTIASALLANEIDLIGRSWKYHRPRGIMGDGAEEPNALFQVEEGAYTTPNVRGTQAEVYPDMVVKSTNAWPTVEFDALSIFGKFAKLLPAGFYYKTFMWPARFWKLYEHFIRQASGLGEAPKEADPEHYDKRNHHCDILIIGSGAAGLMAARSAAGSGARIMLVDEQADFGGRLLSSRADIDGMAASQWVDNAIAELTQYNNVTLLKRATAFGYHDSNFVTVNERVTEHLSLAERANKAHLPRECIWRVRAKQVIIAAGAHERPIPFGNNDLPGVMLASAVSTYLNRYAVVPGNTVVVFTNNDSAYQTVLDLYEAGIAVPLVVDVRAEVSGELAERARKKNINILAGSVITRARGSKQLKSVDIKQLSEDGRSTVGTVRTIDCDVVAVSGGWNPAIHLLAQSGGKAKWNADKQCFEPDQMVQNQLSIGAANGSFSLTQCLQEGIEAAQKAAAALKLKLEPLNLPQVEDVSYQALQAQWRVPLHTKPWRGEKQFIDPQNDVAVADIYLAAREGFHSIEHVKRYTALGFGTDQGKIGNIVGMAVLAEALEQDISATGTTTFRPNYTPVSFGAIAGAEINGTLFDPVRKTAMHGWHEEHGALFENVGQWHRPWYYPRKKGDRLETLDEAVNRECLATRQSVGIMDASTLGKIEIYGKDAGEFLNRIYTNAWKKLGIDCARYGFMLGEDGMVMDDGVTVRLAEDRYFMHTTTGGAASVFNWMERWLQTEWPELEVFLTSVTDHWATAAVVGPNSRKVVAAVIDGIDFDKDAFAFMQSRQGTIDGLPVFVNRISFSGELAYEVNICANYGRHMWERLFAAGEPYNITPYGTESLHVLRAEKGYVIVGQDTDGSVTPVDLGMTWAMSKTKDYIGRRSLDRADCLREGRKQFVGLLTKDTNQVLPEGGQIINSPDYTIPAAMQGHVTSSYYSANVDRSIALALVKDGFKRMGETVYVFHNDGSIIAAEISSTVFIDPEGERQNV